MSRSHDAQETVFAPPGETWQRIQPAMAKVQRLEGAMVIAPITLAAAAVAAFTGLWWLLGVAVVLGAGVFVWYALLVGRQVRAWGYAERAEDLLISHGLVFRQLVVVPYGRMQFVDVSAGPIERWAGIVTVQLHTASAGSDARIPGLLPDDGARLRDRLAERGKALAAGL